jgi:hypothetical protein
LAFSIALSLAVCLIGCGGEPLDYETAMNLLRERTNDPVRTSFSASPHFENQDPAVSEAYQRLIDEHVIQCKRNTGTGTICEPGAAGDALTQDGVSELSLVAGRWVPASILAIRRTGRNAAVADVRMSFQPSQIFQDFESAFDEIQSAGQKLALNAEKQQGKTVQVTFQRYADGWHVESVE